ncbi:MAG: RNA polymerase factor sigma-54 [Synergistaceae bacterium]|jgi:RNA polymerase sigma-54 factor|nr:RNA polymerase factor sigma-54 [Synergistaceae bacterium]
MELELLLSQKLVLSQRMQMSVKILQMNALELNQYILEAALDNPLIEPEFQQEVEDPSLERLKKFEWLDSIDENNFYRYESKADGDESDNIPLYERNAADSLYDNLLQQLPGFHLSEEMEKIARHIIDSLDENGYVSITSQQLMEESGASEAQLEAAICLLHRMEPPGVGARDLKECLLIQAQCLEKVSPVLMELIANHLGLLAKNQLDKLSRAIGVSIGEIREARDQLLTLNPKPGNGYSSYNSIHYISPDMFISHFEGSFQVTLNEYNQPRVKINSFYRKLAEGADPDAAAYICDKLSKAEWLISCIHQRRNTILKCAGNILERQRYFFETGPGNLVPMTLADVAGDLEMHPSTISRAVREKHLQCKWGVFPLSSFFSRNLSAEGDQSQDMALCQIRRIIAEEDPTKPYSDHEICARLERRGICIARRTVAKYREQIGLPSACGRKQFQ